MLVKCKIDNVNDLESNGTLAEYLREYFRYDDGQTHLRIGRDYVVYGLLATSVGLWILICDDEDDDYPKRYPMALFEVIDDKAPEGWVIGNAACFSHSASLAFALLSFPEWSRDAFFYEKLVNGAPQEGAIFQRMREKYKYEKRSF